MTFSRILVVTLFTMACSTSSAAPMTPIADPIPMTETKKAPAKSKATATLAAYERARMLLADDQMKGLPEAAAQIESAATAAGFSAVATSAKALATAKDIEAARVSFGAVSRDVVAVLAGDKALTTGMHIFECPMVKGYKKWIQPSQDMANPYMGKKMLACGGETDWK